ncbi:MAG: leucine-rich repeat domain-containing protein [Prevotella sp.]
MKQRLLTTLGLWMAAVGLAQAQTWTVIDLPATIDDLPAAIEQQLGYPLDSVPNRNLTHIKLKGKDFLRTSAIRTYSGSNNRHQDMYKLVQKAKVLDLSELQYNEDNVNHNNGYWTGSGPDMTLYTLYTIGNELDSLQKMIYPSVATRIDQSLSNCYKLTEVVWPTAAVTYLPSGMFRNDVGLSSMLLPEGLAMIPDNCFTYCENLAEVQIPQSVNEIGGSAFYTCKSLKHVTLPEGLTAITRSMFAHCESLQSVNIPSTVTIIDVDAFYRCLSLSRVDLPEGLTNLEYEAFSYTALRNVVVPNSVTSIGTWVFGYCDSLLTVTLPVNLQEIPENLFRSSHHLRHVDMPRHVRRIRESAFRDIQDLEHLDLPEGLEDIDDYAFNINYLTSVRLPSTLKRLGSCSFCDADRLKAIDIPASVQIIGESAFAGCDSLQDVTLHEGLLMLKDLVFNNSPLVGTVELPATVRFLGKNVFRGNTRRTSFTLPPLLNEVPDGTCTYCDSLRVINLHPGVTRIGNEAFAGGGYWHSAHLSHVDLPEGLVIIAGSAFENQPLEEINIPTTVREIGRYAFNGGKYSRVVLPEGVEKVGDHCFFSDSLKYADFPCTVRCLGGLPLGNGPLLDSIVVRSAIPPLFASWGYTERRSTFYVPEKSVDLYKASASFNYVDSIASLRDYQPGTLVIDQAFSTDSVLYKYGAEKRDLIITLTGENKTDIGRLYVAPQTTMNLGRYRYDYNWQNWYWVNQLPTLIPDGTMTADELEMTQWCNDLNFWHSLTAPFDMRRSDITCANPYAPYSIRVWDGQARANGNHSKVWRDVAADELIPAGTAFILFSGYYPAEKSYGSILNEIVRGWDESCTLHFRSQQPHNTTVFRNDDVTVPLPEYKSEFAHNAGWSMVGNPWQCYFDIQQLDSDAPILVLDQGNQWRQFRAVSPVDDELILRPLQSFLMQRSDQQQSITFKTVGRQNDDVVRHEAAARQNSPAQYRRAQKRANRIRYEAMLSLQTEQGDSLVAHTRLVQNPAATAAYDRGLDAPYITMDESLTALYSMSGSLRYSINEQPAFDADVPLGMYLAEAGTYTLQLTTTGSDPVWLTDHETGAVVDATVPYSFVVGDPGTLNRRFTLQIGDGITSVSSVPMPSTSASATLYDLQGRRISTPAKGLYIQRSAEGRLQGKNGKIVIK